MLPDRVSLPAPAMLKEPVPLIIPENVSSEILVKFSCLEPSDTFPVPDSFLMEALDSTPEISKMPESKTPLDSDIDPAVFNFSVLPDDIVVEPV